MKSPKKLNELLHGFAAADARPIAAIASDSRALTPQTLWLAARGISHHALDFYNPELHPAAIAYEPPYENPPAGAIACEQLGAHLGEIAARFYDHPARALKLIGVTGTDGKSSLVHFLAQATGGAMLGTIGYGKLDALEPASHTTPDPLRVQQYLARFRDVGIETVAMEVSSHALAQGRVAAVEYHIGVFTNLSRDHLDYHRDMEDYFLAKASLFARPLPVAVINIDDAHGRRLLDENRVHPKTRVIAVSSQNHAHPRAALTLRARDIVLSPDGIAYTLETEAEQVAIQSGLLARFNVDNLLNTAACLLALGTPFAAIPAKLAALHGVPGRAERIGLGNGAATCQHPARRARARAGQTVVHLRLRRRPRPRQTPADGTSRRTIRRRRRHHRRQPANRKPGGHHRRQPARHGAPRKSLDQTTARRSHPLRPAAARGGRRRGHRRQRP